ncbi:MAG: type VI secretion system baseplate subunit TssE, partial [Gemmatimonadota bacterium]
SADSPAVQQRLAREVQEALEVFEPRLTSVRVKVAGAAEGERRGIHLLIEGLLRMDPSPQRVRFDTVLEIASGRIDVRSRDG